MDAEQIRKALFPHEETIKRLQEENKELKDKVDALEAGGAPEPNHTAIVKWLRKFGVVVAHPKHGTLYLQGKEFDDYFEDNILSVGAELWGDLDDSFKLVVKASQGKGRKRGGDTGKES